jgi:hypothetical protein
MRGCFGGLGVASYALHHGHETVRALGRQMFLEVQLTQGLGRVDVQDLVGCLAIIEGEKNRDQPAYNMGVAIADEGEARGAAVGLHGRGEPDLARAPLNFVRLRTRVLGERRELPAKFDDIAVPILPLIEKFEISDDILEAWRASVRQRIHILNIEGIDGCGDPANTKNGEGARAGR